MTIPPPKDVNDAAKAGILPDDPYEAAKPVTYEELEAAAARSAAEDTASKEEQPPDAIPIDKKKGNGKGKMGGRETDARTIFTRPKFVRGDEAEMADKLAVSLASDKSLLVHDEGTQYIYSAKSGSWEAIEDEILRAIVKGFAGCDKQTKDGVIALKINASHTRGAVNLLADDTHENGFFNDVLQGVAFKNGFVTCEKGEIKVGPNGPGNRARFAFDFNYDPSTPHPMLDDYLEQVFLNCSEKEKADRIALLQEAAGAALFGFGVDYQQALLLYGIGGGGKSQWAEMMLDVFPASMTSSVPPQKWAERFSSAGLVGKALNVVAELPTSDLVNTEIFKAVITGDYIVGEKKYHPPFKFRSKAMHMFMANTLPVTSDLTSAFFRRFIACPFERDMRKTDVHTPRIGKKIAAAEREGIICWSIIGGARLQAQGRYTEPEAGKKIVADWRILSDTVAQYIQEQCDVISATQDARDGSRASSIYSRYKEWASNSGFKPVSSKTFSTRMELLKLFGKKLNDGTWYPVLPKSRESRGDKEDGS